MRVLSGNNGALLFELNELDFHPGNDGRGFFGRNTVSAGDINQDGFDDLLVPSQLSNGDGSLFRAGSVFVVSSNCALTEPPASIPLNCLLFLPPHHGSFNQEGFGIRVGAIGDVDVLPPLPPDGIPDFVVMSSNTPGSSLSGNLTAFSGKTGLPLWSRAGENAGDFFGVQLTRTRDLNMDAVPDFFASATSFSPPGLPHAGRTYALSASDGVPIFTIDGQLAEGRWFSLALADVTGDGAKDILMGSALATRGGQAGAGAVLAFDGMAMMHPLIFTLDKNPPAENDVWNRAASGWRSQLRRV